MRNKLLKKEYIPGSKAYKAIYEGGGIGYGADPDPEPVSNPRADFAKQAISQQMGAVTESDLQKMRGLLPKVEGDAGYGFDENGEMIVLDESEEADLEDGLQRWERGLLPRDRRQEELLRRMTDIYETKDDEGDPW